MTTSLAEVLPAAGLNRALAERYKEEGNKFRKLNLPERAAREYQKSVAADPTYTDGYYNLGRTYVVLGDRPRAAAALEKLLRINPDDHEARVTLAEQYVQLGRPQTAKAQYEYILARSPRFDPAVRNLAYLKVLTEPGQPAFSVQMRIQSAGVRTMAQAKALVRGYFQSQSDAYGARLLDQVLYEFAPTQAVGQVANLAEYDHPRRLVRLAPEMAFAHPNVVAAYLVHELLHARDNDGVTSVLEEQDGYGALAKFWSLHKDAVVEPNLDLALQLLNESPDKLNQRVRDLYVMRDPLILEKSPGHGLSYAAPAAALLSREADRLEQLSKYTDFIYERLKSLLPMTR